MDGERGKAILRELDQALDALDGYARTIDFARFTTERLAFDGVLHAMTLAGQCAIDLALMIIADRRFGTPPTYREAFDVLARNGVIPVELMNPLGEWASMRNVIIHLYTKLHLETLHEAYTTKTGVLRDFRALAAKLLAEPSPAPDAPPAGSSVREPRVRYRKTAAKPKKARR